MCQNDVVVKHTFHDTQPEAPVKLDQAAATLDDEPVLEEGGVKFAPHFPEPARVFQILATTDDIADADVSIAVNANVEGVRRGGKAPEVLEGEQLDVDA